MGLSSCLHALLLPAHPHSLPRSPRTSLMPVLKGGGERVGLRPKAHTPPPPEEARRGP